MVGGLKMGISRSEAGKMGGQKNQKLFSLYKKNRELKSIIRTKINVLFVKKIYHMN